MDVVNQPILNKDSGLADVRVVVLHHTAGRFQSDYNTLWGDAEVSIHAYILKTGRVYLGVPFGRAAWHCGPSMWHGLRGINQYSIGIELENLGDSVDPYPEAQLKALDWVLVSLIRPVFDNLPITRHRDINSGKIDPSDNFPWGDYSGGIEQVMRRSEISGKNLNEEDEMFRIMRFVESPGKFYLVNIGEMTKRHIPDTDFLTWLRGLNIPEVKDPHPFGGYFIDIGEWRQDEAVAATAIKQMSSPVSCPEVASNLPDETLKRIAQVVADTLAGRLAG